MEPKPLSPAEPSTERPATAEALDLAPHPEGGWFRQTWASPVPVTLPDGRVRPTATLIWFLLPAGESSAWHRVASDELWLAHTGTVALEVGGDGAAPMVSTLHRLGTDLDAGAVSQLLVPAGTWQRTLPSDAEALVSCVVSPGFDFADFELVGSGRGAASAAAGGAASGEIWFDEEDDAAELVKALEAEGYTVTARREGFAGEDDSEDRAWALAVDPFDERVVGMVDVYGGWLPGDDRIAEAPAVDAPPLPDGPRRLQGQAGAESS